MPPRPASPCSRVLRRQLGSPLESLWISDSLLANVFERYCVISRGARRRASSTPGPLESRRRLGKRRIGDLNAGYAPSALPEWILPSALDLSKWKWEPPTLFSAREEKRQEQRQLAEHWLGKWLVPQSVAERTRMAEAPTRLAPSKSLERFQSMIETEPLYELVHACDDICLQFRDDIEPVVDKYLVVETLSRTLEELDARFGHSSDALTLFTQLYSAVFQRLFATPAETRPPVDPELCRGLLTQLLNLPARNELCKLFELTMRFIPARHSDVVAEEVVAVLGKFFVSWSEIPANGMGCEAQVLDIANALSRLSPSKTSIFKTVEQLLLELSEPAEKPSHVRYTWLGVLARLPRLTFSGLFEAFSTLFGDRAVAATVSNMDVCDLLMNHWTSTGRLRSSDRVRSLFEELSSCGESTCIAALCHALYTLEAKWEVSVIDLCNLLRAAGRLNDLQLSFRELAQHRSLHLRLLRKVAVACDDYRVALSLHELYVESSDLQRQAAWSKETWSGYLEQAVSNPYTDIADVWRLLRLCKPDHKTATIAAKLAYETAQSGNLSNRATLRKVTECLRFLQMNGKGLPPAALVAVYHVVTRDLAKGDWGRTSRFNWFLSLVYRECGAEKAEQCRIMLRGWRELVGQAKAQEAGAEENSLKEKN